MGKSTALSGAEGAEGETGANAVLHPVHSPQSLCGDAALRVPGQGAGSTGRQQSPSDRFARLPYARTGGPSGPPVRQSVFSLGPAAARSLFDAVKKRMGDGFPREPRASGKRGRNPREFPGLPEQGEVCSQSSPSSSSCHNAATASDGIRRVGAKSACLCFRLRRKRRPLPCSSFPHKIFDFAGTPVWRLAGESLP